MTSAADPAVLFLTGEYPPAPGGVGDYTANLRLALAGAVVRSVVLTSDAARDPRDRDVVSVARWGWSLLRRVPSLIAERDIDLVHIQYQAGAFAMHPAVNLLPFWLRRRGIPVVTTFHDLRPPYLFPKAGRTRNALMLRMARWSAAVIVTNPADDRVLASAGISATRIPIGPNLPPLRRTAAVQPRTVAFFGFPARSKGVETLIASLGSIASERRPELVLVGAQGTPSVNNDILSAAEIDRLAEQEDVVIRRTGYLGASETTGALAEAGAIVLPYRTGASQRNGSLLAALQSGRPVVATMPAELDDLGSLAALPQLLLAPTHGVESLRDAILAALAEQHAFSPLPEEYRWQSIAARHRELYVSVPVMRDE
jgi:glycosyltransferase involved in cell wall biosynthesis